MSKKEISNAASLMGKKGVKAKNKKYPHKLKEWASKAANKRWENYRKRAVDNSPLTKLNDKHILEK